MQNNRINQSGKTEPDSITALDLTEPFNIDETCGGHAVNDQSQPPS